MPDHPIVSFIRLGRPVFLGGGFVMFGLGAAIAASTGHHIDPTRYVLGQAVVTAFQLMTHYANEFFDYEADRANTTPTRWSGGSRVLIAGALSRRVALVASLVIGTLGCALTAILATAAGPLTVPIAGTIATLAWIYSAPPLRLCARGLGELDTAVVVTLLVPLLAFYLQAPDGRGLVTVVMSTIPLALLQFSMLLAIELPDAAGDAATGKRTLVVRVGAARAAQLYATTTFAGFGWLLLALLFGQLPLRVAASALALAPLAAWRIARIGDHADQRRHEAITSCAVLLVVGTATGELAGWLVS